MDFGSLFDGLMDGISEKFPSEDHRVIADAKKYREDKLSQIRKAMINLQVFKFLEERGSEALIPELRTAIENALQLRDKRRAIRKKKRAKRGIVGLNLNELKLIAKADRDPFKSIRGKSPRRGPDPLPKREKPPERPQDPLGSKIAGPPYKAPPLAKVIPLRQQSEYDVLPMSIKSLYSQQEWNVLPDRQKSSLVEDESIPDTFDDMEED